MNHKLLQMRIIHLSDVHFGSGHRFTVSTPPDGIPPPGRGIPSLADSIRADLESPEFSDSMWLADGMHPTPLVVALSGDITQTASSAEFGEAKKLISSLTAAPLLKSSVAPRDVFVVPGNHDVIYDEPDPGRRWYPYCDFYEGHSGVRIRPSEAYDLTRIIDRSNDGFIVAEINSCFDVRKGGFDAIRGHVDQGALTSLKAALKSLSEEKLKNTIRIALVHHHPIVLPSLAEPERGYDAVVNSEMLLTILREHGFHLILHGHKHYPHTFSYDTQCAWANDPQHPLMIIAGGSAGAGVNGLPEVPGATNTYNAIAFKWNPEARHGRVNIVTRGLVRFDDNNKPLPAGEWHWKTLKIDDRMISSGPRFPDVRVSEARPFDNSADATYDSERTKDYGRLRGNMLVADVLPSLQPGQAYEVRVWLVPHKGEPEPPMKVEWSAGPSFPSIKVCERRDTAPEYAARFAYWGGMMVQAKFIFEDGAIETGTIYARIPGI